MDGLAKELKGPYVEEPSFRFIYYVGFHFVYKLIHVAGFTVTRAQ